MNDTVKVPVFANEGLQNTSQGESQPVTDKANASSEQKKAYAFDKQFGELNGKIKKRDAQIAEKDKTLETMNGKMSELEAQVANLTAPKAPNAELEFDNPDEFKRQTDAFNAHAITKLETGAIEKAKVEFRQELATEREQEKLRKNQEEFAEQGNNHIKKGEAIGLTEEDMVVSANLLDNAGVPNEVQSFLFNDPEGPQIMDFLANNPKELEAMIELPTLNQAAYIERVIRVNAVSTKPTVTNAPNPLINIQGGGMREQDEFEKKYPGAVFKTSK